jgi:hypothetical protein
MSHRTLVFLALPATLALGCAHNQGEQVRDARLTQTEQREEAALEAVDQREQHQENAIDRDHEHTERALSASGSPDAEQRESVADVERDRAQYLAEARAELDKLAIRIDTTQKKMAVLGGRVPTRLQTELGAARTEHQTLQRSVTELPSATPDGWDGQKKVIEKRLDELDDRVEKLADAIDGAA